MTRECGSTVTWNRPLGGWRCDGCAREWVVDAPAPVPDVHLFDVDRELLSDLLCELFPLGLTEDCPARRDARTLEPAR